MSNKNSITAYDLEKRVKSYDADMDLMHPNRLKMIQIALEFLPYDTEESLRVIDLGIGTGFFTLEFLKKYHNSSVIGIDGAKTMIDLAKARLNLLSDKIEFIVGDFRNIKKIFSDIDEIDIVLSSYALHHLNSDEKTDLLKFLNEKIRVNGWFINADLIIAESQIIEDYIQEIRINGIINRSNGKDPRFSDFNSTRKFLDELESHEKDQPLPLSKDLKLMEYIGFKNIDILWKEYREVVVCAQKK